MSEFGSEINVVEDEVVDDEVVDSEFVVESEVEAEVMSADVAAAVAVTSADVAAAVEAEVMSADVAAVVVVVDDDVVSEDDVLTLDVSVPDEAGAALAVTSTLSVPVCWPGWTLISIWDPFSEFPKKPWMASVSSCSNDSSVELEIVLWKFNVLLEVDC